MKIKIGGSAAILIGSVLLAFLLAEGLVRWLVFSDWGAAGPWRHPRVYADYYGDDDYWILYDRMNRQWPRPKKVHPSLGWLDPWIDSETYEHPERSRIGSRRVVLLYGDSFASAWPAHQLNDDSTFAQKWYFLNYGHGGYGLDQIYLLYQRSVTLYDSPVVLISFLLEDIDRCILSIRDYAKPYFSVTCDNNLALKGIPIPADVDSYYSTKSLSIHSYLYAAAIHNPLVPERIRRWLTNADDKDDRKKKIAEFILLHWVDDLKRSGLPFVFLVFHPVQDTYAQNDWRTNFVEDLFKRNQIQHVFMRDVLRSSIKQQDYDPHRFFRSKDDWHGNESWYGYMSRWLIEQLAADAKNLIHREM